MIACKLGPYTFHSDPSHGWMEVPFEDVYLLGIGDDLSQYSYMSEDGKTLYLEEDADYYKFQRAWKVMVLQPPRARLVDNTEFTDEPSFIRNLSRIDWDLLTKRGE